MPLYAIHHSTPLTPSQRQSLASSITFLHCITFSAPSAFVNISFHPSPADTSVFVGGRECRTNYILGHLRPRANNGENLSLIVREVTKIWNAVVRDAQGTSVSGNGNGDGVVYVKKKGEGRLDDERALHNVFLMEDIVAGSEQGFELPAAGEDEGWAKKNMEAFEERARDGDEGMRRLVEEYKGRV